MLIHIVTFTFTPSTTTAEIAAFHSATTRFAGEAPYVRVLRHGPDLGDRPTNAGYGVVGEFDDADDFYAYLDHPVHRGFLASTVVPMCDSWSATQFVTD